MQDSRRQRGWIHFPDGFFGALFALAAIGLVALIVFGAWALYWLITHVRFV